MLSEALASEHVAMAVAGGVAVLVVCVYGLRLPASAGGEVGRALVLVCGVLALSLAVALAARPVLNHFKSGACFVREARPYLDETERGVFALRGPPYLDEADVVCLHKKGFSGVYNLHTGRLAMEVLPNRWRMRQRLRQDERVAVIACKSSEKTIEEMTSHLQCADIHVPVRRWVGDRLMFLIVNWRDEGRYTRVLPDRASHVGHDLDRLPTFAQETR